MHDLKRLSPDGNRIALESTKMTVNKARPQNTMKETANTPQEVVIMQGFFHVSQVKPPNIVLNQAS